MKEQKRFVLNVLIVFVIIAVVCLLATLASAQTTLSVDINKATLDFQWAPGVAPNNGTPDWFDSKCGSASKVYTKITRFTNPAIRSLPILQVIAGSGNWFCVVAAGNAFGVSGDSNEVPFAAGAVPSSPTNVVVTGH